LKVTSEPAASQPATSIEARFRRITGGGVFIPQIDGLRFVAIASVVAFHLYAQLVRYKGVAAGGLAGFGLRHGDRGVSLFFVISGFILGVPFASRWLTNAPPVKLGKYFFRRLTRLEPPYILNLLLCFFLLVSVNHVSFRSLVPHLLASMVYGHNFIYGTPSTVNPVAWSLEVEVQFYCLVPMLALIFVVPSKNIRRCLMLVAMLVIGLAQLRWMNSEVGSGRFTIAYYLQFFIAGFVLADIYLTEARTVHWGWDWVSFAGWPLVFLLDSPSFYRVGMPFVVIAVYIAAFRGQTASRVFRWPALTIVGGMCYTIYLLHFTVIAAVTRFVPHRAEMEIVILFIPVAILAILLSSAVYYLLIERPCMDKHWPTQLASAVVRKTSSFSERWHLRKVAPSS
jgi:peptidoglycan/LPS O-acetylase OafA/YrhL